MLKKRMKDYVCEVCFYQLKSCKCVGGSPYRMIMIDEEIQEHIRILKDKKYITTGSCAGHQEICFCTYISFAIDYDFGSMQLPKDFVYNKKRRTITYEYQRGLSKECFKKLRKEKLNDLLEWCRTLPTSEIR